MPEHTELVPTEKAWLPDGRGLPGATTDLVGERNMPVHLRLTSPDGRSARGACGRGLGEWWTGRGVEVNCPACLEVVHA
jgi:hypothetical protein